MAVDKDLLQLDLYGLLGVGEKASEKEVKKAYRQKALTCHPDKNPDNPQAAEVFHQLSQALAVLTDAAARAAYDKVRKAKKQAAERTQKLDEKRKKVKLDLEAREREAQARDNEEEEIRITRTLEQEIIRLREEGSRQLEEQQRLIREQIQLERQQRIQGSRVGSGAEGRVTPKLKLKWKCRKEDETGGGYSKEVLLRILQKEMAVKNEVGLTDNPLKISWLEGQPRNNPSNVLSDSSGQPRTSQASVVSERDYESLVMMRMRQAAERQQLIAQLRQEDEEESHT
ncbi:dnaJ homolog subfamily C member 17 isoform X3 [Gallus gallus]|uniref:dnaJ homolog subfamily C member 17 isoform X3 n=1 Tax=Gallus gallus TaxID=9031 RepID=UPI000240B84C|nr:dnaJ homolog subfamily C member 17 isoform X3 [Gallus gallus]XP_046774862.1 dnaJ homolog subfamily C member 17 isoform X3 [Gallus gallus]|eukprot:XP_025006611.1 dnaJ homolog subfamily C member 17 isoform X2 [Gallus gallus]